MEINNKERLDRLVSATPSRWEEKAKWRKTNSVWLKKSSQISIKILETLRRREMTQRTLAELMGTSPQYTNRLLSGKENLTLETITKIEMLLNIELISISSHSITTEITASTHIAPNSIIASSKMVVQSKPLSNFSIDYSGHVFIPAA